MRGAAGKASEDCRRADAKASQEAVDPARAFVQEQALARLQAGQPLFAAVKFVFRRPAADRGASIGPYLWPARAVSFAQAEAADRLGQYHDLLSLLQGEFQLPKGL